MNKQLVYDLPTRAFHAVFAVLFVTAFGIAKIFDDESPQFSYHMLAGLLLSFVVSLRLIWGVFGSRYARFTSFALKPSDLWSYFIGIFTGNKKKWAGHNPASSWAAIIMITLAVGLGITGYLMASGQKENFEDIHELLANSFLIVVLLHIAGVVLHALRFDDGIGLTMLTGQKSNILSEEKISSSRPMVAILFFVLTAIFAMYLANHYNKQTQTLDLLGSTLQLGEGSDSQRGDGENSQETEKDDDD